MTERSNKRKQGIADLEAVSRRDTGPAYPPQNAAQPQMSHAQQHQQALEDRKRREAAQRLSRKPTDRNIPDDLSNVVIGDGVDRYKKLRDVERKLDAVMMQKRLDISEGMSSQMKSEGTLRIWVSNTAEGQPWQVMEEGGSGIGEDGTFDFADDNQATYRVKIEGRLLEDPLQEELSEDKKDGDAMEQDGASAQQKAATKDRTKLSHFFKAITIDFDRAPSLQPDGLSTIEWKKPVPNPQAPGSTSTESEANFDRLEFQRKGDEEVNITISLIRDEMPERYKLSSHLAALLDMDEGDRASVVAGIWEYVRGHGLQEDDEHRKIVCDEQLRAVFGSETLFFPYVPELIQPHLKPLAPIKLQYTIRVDREYISPSSDSTTPASQPTIYDIRVPLPSSLKRTMQSLHTSRTHIETLKSITQIDDDIALLVQKMAHENSRRRFYDSLARDPARFIKRWVGSQQRDLEIVLAEGGRGLGDEGYAGEEFRRGGDGSVWGGDLARESVGLWLARQKAAH